MTTSSTAASLTYAQPLDDIVGALSDLAGHREIEIKYQPRALDAGQRWWITTGNRVLARDATFKVTLLAAFETVLRDRLLGVEVGLECPH